MTDTLVKRENIQIHKKKRQCGDVGRNQSGAATSQGMQKITGATRS